MLANALTMTTVPQPYRRYHSVRHYCKFQTYGDKTMADNLHRPAYFARFIVSNDAHGLLLARSETLPRDPLLP
jgi:hypothetical protein